MGGVLGCLGTQLVCCCSSAACHCFSLVVPKNSVATRIAFAVLFMITSIFAWTLQAGWVDDLFAKIPKYPNFNFYDCPEGNCFSGNFAVARVLFSLSVFHFLFSLLMIRVKNSKDFRAKIQNGFWGPKLLLLSALVVASFFIPDPFFHTYSVVAFIGAIFFLFIQLVLLIDFAATWSENWVKKWENTESKLWLGLLIGTGLLLGISFLAITIALYVLFGHKGCKLNIFFVTFNLLLGLLSFGLSVSKPVQEARPSSGILQAGVIAMYSTYLLTSGLSDETEEEGEQVCNPFAEGGRTASTVFGTIFTFVAIAYSTTRAASNSKVLMGVNQTPETVFGGEEEDKAPLVINQAPTPTAMVDPRIPSSTPSSTTQDQNQNQNQNQTSQPSTISDQNGSPQGSDPKTENGKEGEKKENSTPTPSSPSSQPITSLSSPQKNSEQEMVELGIAPDVSQRRRLLEEAVEAGSLPKSVLDEEDGKSKKGSKKADEEEEDEEEDEEDLENGKKKKLSKEDERKGCVYNYSFYHAIFCVAAMYVTMLINKWGTTNIENGGWESVGHDWVTVWVKIVCSWAAVALYVWTLVAPILLPDRDWS